MKTTAHFKEGTDNREVVVLFKAERLSQLSVLETLDANIGRGVQHDRPKEKKWSEDGWSLILTIPIFDSEELGNSEEILIC